MTNPAEAMPRRSSWWNSMTVRRICFPSLVRCAFGPLAHSRVWPCDRALRRAYQTGPQECLRVVGQSRSDEDRVPSSLELRSIVLGMCTNAPSRLPIPALLDLSKGVLALPRLRQESRMYLFPPFFELIDILCQVPCVSTSASLLIQGFIFRSFLEFCTSRNSLLRYTFLLDSLRLTLSFPISCVTHRGLREHDCVIWSQLPNFPQITLFLRTILGHTTHMNVLFQTGHWPFFRHFSLTFYCAAHPPQCVWNDNGHLSCIRTQTCYSGKWEGAINHMTVSCTLSENLHTVFCLSILKDLLLLDCHFDKASIRQSGSAFSK